MIYLIVILVRGFWGLRPQNKLLNQFIHSPLLKYPNRSIPVWYASSYTQSSTYTRVNIRMSQNDEGVHSDGRRKKKSQ